MTNEELKLAKFLAIKFAEEKIDWKQWPEDVVAEQSNYEVSLEGWKRPDERWDVGFECDGEFPYLEEWDDNNSITQEEFFSFMEANPTYVQDIQVKRQEAVAEIARLNQIAYDAVEQAMKLSDSVDLPYSCRMPSGVADLDENSDWNSSRC